MLWQDSRGNWNSTMSTTDLKIQQAMIESNANRIWDEKERSGDWLFDEMFGG